MATTAFPSPLLLIEAHVHDHNPDQSATYVCISNTTTSTVNLTGWQLLSSGTPLQFPPGAAVAGGASLWIARDARAFAREMTHSADYTLLPAADVPVMLGSAAAWDPQHGSIALLNPAGVPVDALVWGDAPPIAGWRGPGVPMPEAGVLCRRAIDEQTLSATCPGLPAGAGAEAAAWRQGSDWLPRRAPRVGQGELPLPTCSAPSAVAFTSPDCAYGAIAGFLDAAQSQLDLNLYLFTQEALAAHVEAALQRKVRVRVLAEGEPMGTGPLPDRDLLQRLHDAGAQVQVLQATPEGFKRYHFDHAKYVVADGKRCLIMSDNWTHDSTPTRAQTGLRGWGVILDSPDLAAHLTHVFERDWNPNTPDSRPFPESRLPVIIESLTPASAGAPRIGLVENIEIERLQPLPLVNPATPLAVTSPTTIIPVLAPQHALLATRGISGLLAGARRTLDIQQASVPPCWGYDEDASPDRTPNLFLTEMLAAARRGVRVRLLLDGSHISPKDQKDNADTQQFLANIAGRENLPLVVRVLDYKSTHMSIHNKGIIADGQQVLVSSINWTENSPLNNRELGLILQNSEIVRYFADLFERDWQGGM